MTATQTEKTTKREKRAEVVGLPTLCPSWCNGGPQGHRAALEEGCEVEDARVHLSADLAGQVNDISNYLAKRVDRPGNGGWNVQLRQDAPDPGGYYAMALVQLEVHTHQRRSDGSDAFNFERLDLTTAEARQLAAQLVYLADAEDLHANDH